MYKTKKVSPNFRFKRGLKLSIKILATALVLVATLQPAYSYAGTTCGSSASGTATHTSIDIGCTGQGNAITDATFAIIRFLTDGVGVVLVGSMVYAGIQYTAAKGDPGGTKSAINRIRSNVVALLVFAFAYALLNYIIPGQVFK